MRFAPSLALHYLFFVKIGCGSEEWERKQVILSPSSLALHYLCTHDEESKEMA